jgi:hypothetical protein
VNPKSASLSDKSGFPHLKNSPPGSQRTSSKYTESTVEAAP